MILYGSKYPKSQVQRWAIQFLNADASPQEAVLLMMGFFCRMSDAQMLANIQKLADGAAQQRI